METKLLQPHMQTEDNKKRHLRIEQHYQNIGEPPDRINNSSVPATVTQETEEHEVSTDQEVATNQNNRYQELDN